MKMRDRSVWAFDKNVGFTDRLLLDSFMKKCLNKEFVYVRIHLIFFVRGYIFAYEEYIYEIYNFSWE